MIVASQEIKTYLARLVRKLILRGRAATSYYSLEGYQSAPDEPVQNIIAQRYQHYGLLSEPPDGAEVIALAINGGASNRIGIAEHVTDEPTLQDQEVLLWSRYGQRLLLDNNSRVNVNNGDGGSIVVEGDTTTISQDMTVVRDLTVTRDIFGSRDLTVARDSKADHVIGSGDAVLTATAAYPSIVLNVSATGDDTSFDLNFDVANGNTLLGGMDIATVNFRRAFASAPRCVVSLVNSSWPTGSALGYSCTDGNGVLVRYQGSTSIAGPVTGLKCTVMIRGRG